MAVFAIVLTGAAFTLCVVYLATDSQARDVRARAPQHPGVHPGVLDTYDLALLTAGTARAGEVALTELFLDGDVEIRRGRIPLLRGAPITRAAARARTSHAQRHFVVELTERLVRRAQRRGRRHAHPAAVVGTVRGRWKPTVELARLRDAGLMLPAGALRASRGWRTAATALQAVAVLGLAMYCAMTSITLFGVLERYDLTLSVAPPVHVITLVLLIMVYARFGVVGVVVTVGVIDAGYLALGARPAVALAAGVIACLAWLVVYGIYVATGGTLGTRTPAGDALLAEERARLARGTGTEPGRDRALRAVALYGLAGVRRRLGRDELPHPDDTLPRVADLARLVGATHRRGTGPNADGGAGGSVGDSGDAGGFPGGDGSGGGPGGGDGGGDGGGGGD